MLFGLKCYVKPDSLMSKIYELGFVFCITYAYSFRPKFVLKYEPGFKTGWEISPQ